MKTRYAMAVDTRRCVGCNACVIACKTENALPSGGFRDWVATEVGGAFPELHMEIRSERCNHCDEPSCVSACPTGASQVGEGGVVLVNESRCTGCKACIAACPYDARYVHPAGFVDKCTFCLHRVRKGQPPACVETCPTRSLTFGDLGDAESAVSRLVRGRRRKVLKPESGNQPRVYFLS
ncbi:MAG TPA: 4Fe-4S dicluster domain-containing protein [Anaeromyxobacteraceae bacterium]|nr:4Fe-4S dicluster domain-containing protein [Anaeromyxobacteraceae bacterium]